MDCAVKGTISLHFSRIRMVDDTESPRRLGENFGSHQIVLVLFALLQHLLFDGELVGRDDARKASRRAVHDKEQSASEFVPKNT